MNATIPLMHFNMFSSRLEKAATHFAERVSTSKSFTNCELLKREIDTLSMEIRYLVHLLEELTLEIKTTESTPDSNQLGSTTTFINVARRK